MRPKRLGEASQAREAGKPQAAERIETRSRRKGQTSEQGHARPTGKIREARTKRVNGTNVRARKTRRLFPYRRGCQMIISLAAEISGDVVLSESVVVVRFFAVSARPFDVASIQSGSASSNVSVSLPQRSHAQSASVSLL